MKLRGNVKYRVMNGEIPPIGVRMGAEVARIFLKQPLEGEARYSVVGYLENGYLPEGSVGLWHLVGNGGPRSVGLGGKRLIDCVGYRLRMCADMIGIKSLVCLPVLWELDLLGELLAGASLLPPNRAGKIRYVLLVSAHQLGGFTRDRSEQDGVHWRRVFEIAASGRKVDSPAGAKCP